MKIYLYTNVTCYRHIVTIKYHINIIFTFILYIILESSSLNVILLENLKDFNRIIKNVQLR